MTPLQRAFIINLNVHSIRRHPTQTILITYRNIAGVEVVQARPLGANEPVPEGAYDFQGQTMRIIVYPSQCSLTRDDAYDWAVRYANEPFENKRVVDWSRYSHANAPFNKGIKQAYERTHKRKPKKERGGDASSTSGE